MQNAVPSLTGNESVHVVNIDIVGKIGEIGVQFCHEQNRSLLNTRVATHELRSSRQIYGLSVGNSKRKEIWLSNWCTAIVSINQTTFGLSESWSDHASVSNLRILNLYPCLYTYPFPLKIFCTKHYCIKIIPKIVSITRLRVFNSEITTYINSIAIIWLLLFNG